MTNDNRPSYLFWFKDNIDQYRRTVVLMDFKQRGIFQDLRCLYWLCECDLPIDLAVRELGVKRRELEAVVRSAKDTSIIDDRVSIPYLDEDFAKAARVSAAKSRAANIKHGNVRPIAGGASDD